jgi:secondary thiamine-phosphate synthase enzyme
MKRFRLAFRIGIISGNGEVRAMVRTETIGIETRGNGHMVDVTDRVAGFVSACGLTHGAATVFVPGATGAVTTIEYESRLEQDFARLMQELAPQQREYAHNARWRDGNGHSHVRASLLGPSLTVPVQNGRLLLGTWQQIIVLDFDVLARTRKIVFQAIGE